MDGPHIQSNPAISFLSWLKKYDRRKCDIILGSRRLNITPYYGQTIYNLLRINHWALYFVFDKEMIVIENVALNTVEDITTDELKIVLAYPGEYFLRRDKEGDEIISHNHLIRFVRPEQIDSELKQVKYIQTVNFKLKKVIRLCLKYIQDEYVFLGRNCQTFSRYINYGLGKMETDWSTTLELHVDGYSYLLLFGVILLLVVWIKLTRSYIWKKK